MEDDDGPFTPLASHLLTVPKIKDISQTIISVLCPQTGASLQKLHELRSLETHLEESRRRYLRARILMNAAKDVLLFGNDDDEHVMDEANDLKECFLLGEPPRRTSSKSLSIDHALPNISSKDSPLPRPLRLNNPKALNRSLNETLQGFSSLIQIAERLNSSESTEVDYIRLKLSTFTAKAEMTQFKILSDIYEPQSAIALQKIYKHFKAKLRALEDSKAETIRSLEQYDHVDNRFHSVLENYIRLKNEISAKEWAVQNIGK